MVTVLFLCMWWELVSAHRWRSTVMQFQRKPSAHTYIHTPWWVFWWSLLVLPNIEASCSGMTISSLTLPSGCKCFKWKHGFQALSLNHHFLSVSPSVSHWLMWVTLSCGLLSQYLPLCLCACGFLLTSQACSPQSVRLIIKADCSCFIQNQTWFNYCHPPLKWCGHSYQLSLA